MKNKIIALLFGMILIIYILPLAFAGVGIKWDRDSALVKEGEKTCLTYNVYNPWPEDTWVTIDISDNLKEIMSEQSAETKLIPSNTPSISAIPIEFCFIIPMIYPEDCLVMDKLICKKEYNGELKVYSGEVTVKSVPPPSSISGSGGSTTAMAVGAPLNVRVEPNNHPRNFTLLYMLIAIISLLIVVIMLYRKYRKPALLRDEEALKRLKEKIKREKIGKRK